MDKCYNNVCCPKERNPLDKNKKEGSSFQNDEENKIILNASINNDNDDKKNGNIFLFENDEFNNINKNGKIKPNEYENTNLDHINLMDNSFKNEVDLINKDNVIKNSSQKSILNSSNFSFKRFMKKEEEDLNKDIDVNINHKAKTRINKSKKSIHILKEIENNSKGSDDNNINNGNEKYTSYYLSQVIKIQRIYRAYINMKKISEKKTNFEDDNDKDKNFDSNLNLSKIKSSKNYSALLLNRFLINIDYIDVSEESFRSVTMKSNKCQIEQPQFCTLRDLDIDQVKGYFLLKKKMFKYQGQKDKDGKKIGFGRIFWEDSSKLKGYFTNSKVNGIVYFYNCGNETSTFFGEYKNNIPEGYGIYSRKGFSLEGTNWNKNCLNDIGIAIWEEGEMYEGEFKNNSKEGLGLYRWADGTTYMGQFQKNKICGFGRMQFANGNSYEGEFYEGFIHGFGKFVWDDGKYYIGNYVKDKKHGFGIFVWNLEPLIAMIGFWNQGKQNGVCVRLYKGHFKFVLVQESKNNIEINSKWELNKYLKPSQAKYKNFFKKKYNEFAKFVNFASKW